MKKLIAAVAMVVLATPAFAAVQNVKVSGSITSYFVDRSDFDFNPAVPGVEPTKYQQSFFYTSTHVLISSDLSDNVSAQVGLANEVYWGDNNYSNSASGGGTPSYSGDQAVELELANVTLREFLYSPLTLTIGRQAFTIGNDFIIGSNTTTVGTMQNVATDMSRTQNYDGATAVLDYKPLTITGFYFKYNAYRSVLGISPSNIVNGVNTEAGYNKTSDNLSGVVANYQLNDPFSTVVEGTFISDTNINPNYAVGGKASTLYIPDLRVSTNPTKDLTVGAEVAIEGGNNYNSSATPDNNEKISKAWSYQATASYNLPVLTKYKPNVTERLSYYSGENDKDANHKDTAWTPLTNDQNLGTSIWRALYNTSDLYTSELSASVSPLEDVTVKATWTDLWLADAFGLGQNGTLAGVPAEDGTFLALPDGQTLPNLSVKDNRGLGNEYDGLVTYQYTEDVSFGLNLGYFKPGSLYTGKNANGASEAIVSVGVNF